LACAGLIWEVSMICLLLDQNVGLNTISGNAHGKGTKGFAIRARGAQCSIVGTYLDGETEKSDLAGRGEGMARHSNSSAHDH